MDWTNWITVMTMTDSHCQCRLWNHLRFLPPVRPDLARTAPSSTRRVTGGPVVIHAVRGTPVGAAAVHALAGAMTAAGATKGILVSLGGVEPAAYDALAGRPLELIDGPGLVTLLAQHCRIKARIELTGQP